MSSDVRQRRPSVEVEGLGKAYTIRHAADRPATLAESVWKRLRRLGTRDEVEVVWALRDVSFRLDEGEVLGVVGRNGAGKSTLLKLLSRITPPTEGEVRLWGRVGSLLEVGTGFHRELTGRENLYLNGSILGMRRAEIDARFDEIVDFAGVRRFLDTPVKRYSSGMYVRLAFAVAAHLDPEILIVDEVLSVGDAEFRRKCLAKMEDVSSGGRTVLLVSHNASTIESLCERCLWLEGGQVRAIGPTSDVLPEYLAGVGALEAQADLRDHPGRQRGRQKILQSVHMLDGAGAPSSTVPAGEGVRIRILVEPEHPLPTPEFGVLVVNARRERVFLAHTRFAPIELSAIDGRQWVECELGELALVPGRYTVSLTAGMAGEDLDYVEDAISFEVLSRDYYGTGRMPTARQGNVLQRSQWSQGEVAERELSVHLTGAAEGD